MNIPIPDDPNYQDLRDAIRGAQCVAFIGSGPSSSHYPSWGGLVRKLCETCGIAAELADSADTATLLALADECKSRNDVAYCQCLEYEFAKPVTDIPKVYVQVAKLPFKSYITTNFDPLLKEAIQFFGRRCSGVYSPPSFKYESEGGGALYHIHGLVQPGNKVQLDSLVLTESDFKQAYSELRGTLRSFLTQVLTYESCFFLGGKLQEPELMYVSDLCHVLRKEFQPHYRNSSPPRHWILRPMVWQRDGQARDYESEQTEATTYRELGIQVVYYNPVDTDHSGLTMMLDGILQRPEVAMLSGWEPRGSL